MHPCEVIYQHGPKPLYGDTTGACRITGKPGIGLPFQKWVRDTFTDIGNLHPGDIICNEALFCFEEQSTYLQERTGKEKPQRFRTYSHIVAGGEWYALGKDQKADIMRLMLSSPDVCVIAETGQPHLVFKHKPGTWMFERETIQPDPALFTLLQGLVHALSGTFTNDEIAAGKYLQYRIMSYGLAAWQDLENVLKKHRGSAMFDLALFFSKINLNPQTTEDGTTKPTPDPSPAPTPAKPAGRSRKPPVSPLSLFE